MPDTGGPDDPPVVFLLPDGTEISNDPRWQAQKFKEQVERQSHNLAEQARFAAEEQAKADALARAEEEGEDDEEDSEAAPLSDYDHMTVPELKELADERDLDYSGLKKKSELVDLLKNSE